MKNTRQIIGMRVMLTFVVLEMPPQQMFAHTAERSDYANSPSENDPWKTVIFSEIMPDPSPPRGLPEAEYVELFNRTSVAINLARWHLSDETTSISLPDMVLPPHEYVVVTSRDLGIAAPHVLTTNLPSLNNAGDLLTLTDSAGHVVDVLHYSNAWYHDSQRRLGGWSLELIDPENTCETAENWRVTEDPRGGTPGHQNSIFASNPDVTGPDLISAQPLDEHTLRLVFNEKLSLGAVSSGQWFITPPLGAHAPSFQDSARTAVTLRLDRPMQSGVLYTLALEDISDCAGNSMHAGRRLQFALPSPANQGDVVINEVLFNPRPDGVDFVELFNVSGKYIALNGWAIGSVDDDGNSQKANIAETLIIPPHGYIAFTADRGVLQAAYEAADTTLAELKLPAFPDDHGSVMVFNDLDTLIDQFAYSANMHNVFVRDPEGVSLERLSAARRADDPSNWTSASSLTGYGTPGRRNSATTDAFRTDDRTVQVIPSVFTPVVGEPNAATIAYHFDKPGFVGTVSICDNRGLVIRRLANNALLAAEGIIRWEGDRDDGNKAQSGYYLVWFQVFGSDGSSRVYRLPVAVSSKY